MKKLIITKIKNRKFIELSLYVFLIIIFFQNLVVYNLKFQHDAQLHHYPIFYILNLDFDQISTTHGIFYYFYVSIFSIISYPFYKLQILDPRSSFYLMIKISNLILFISSIYYSLKISKKLFGKANLNYILPILIIFSISSFHRTFLMVRPENLIILCTLISFYFLNKLLINNYLNTKNFIILSIVLFTIGSAKMNGFYYNLCFFFFLLIFCKNNIHVFKLSIIVFSLIFSYYFLHSEISLMGVYDRPYGIDEARSLGKIGLFNLDKDLRVFTNFSLLNSWNHPFRYSHSDSMINTLALDLYGDYYGYGIFNHLKTQEGIWTKDFVNLLIKLNRLSLILSCLYFILLTISILYVVFNLKNIIENNSILLFFIALFLAGILFLIAFTIFEYYGVKNTTYKWEYINFLIMGTGYVISFYFFKTFKNLKIKLFNLLSISSLILLANYQLLQFRF